MFSFGSVEYLIEKCSPSFFRWDNLMMVAVAVALTLTLVGYIIAKCKKSQKNAEEKPLLKMMAVEKC